MLALARLGAAPQALKSLAAVGTAMELAGVAGPGSTHHLLCAASLLQAAGGRWGEGDVRVEAAAKQLLEVWPGGGRRGDTCSGVGAG